MGIVFNRIKNVDPLEECSICMEPFKEETVVAHPAFKSSETGTISHIFHEKCLMSHISASLSRGQQPFCPQCRKVIAVSLSKKMWAMAKQSSWGVVKGLKLLTFPFFIFESFKYYANHREPHKALAVVFAGSFLMGISLLAAEKRNLMGIEIPRLIKIPKNKVVLHSTIVTLVIGLLGISFACYKRV